MGFGLCDEYSKLLDFFWNFGIDADGKMIEVRIQVLVLWNVAAGNRGHIGHAQIQHQGWVGIGIGTLLLGTRTLNVRNLWHKPAKYRMEDNIARANIMGNNRATPIPVFCQRFDISDISNLFSQILQQSGCNFFSNNAAGCNYLTKQTYGQLLIFQGLNWSQWSNCSNPCGRWGFGKYMIVIIRFHFERYARNNKLGFIHVLLINMKYEMFVNDNKTGLWQVL